MSNEIKPHTNILHLFENKEFVKVCAPMVRYSKLQFRNLVKLYNCDLFFTPMILADSFCKSSKARDNEFTTNFFDTPLVTQFAANTVYDFVGAACMVSPFCDGVDLNCGCPQRWAKQQGLGCVILEKPELIYDLVRQTRNRIAKPFTVSVKMRLKKDMKKSVEICRQLEHCGASFLTVHGRTPEQSTGAVNLEGLKLIVENVGIPVVANGGVRNLQDCLNLQKVTNCRGVMVANGLLCNPTLFTNSVATTLDCIQNWLNICYNSTLLNVNKNPQTIPEKPPNLTFQCFHHHLVFMLDKILTREEKRLFNNLQTFSQVLIFIEQRFEIKPQLYEDEIFQKRIIWDLDYASRDVYLELKPPDLGYTGCDILYESDATGGKFFQSKIKEDEGNCDWFNIFGEKG